MASTTFHRFAMFLHVLFLWHYTLSSRVKPFGIIQCERLCLKTSGCWSYVYVTSDVSCKLIQNRRTKFGNDTYMFNITMKVDDVDRICVKTSKIFLTRNGKLKCTEDIKGVCHHNGQQEPLRPLLLLPYRKSTNVLHCYYPATDRIRNIRLGRNTEMYINLVSLSTHVLLNTEKHDIKVFNIETKKTVFVENRLITSWSSGKDTVYTITFKKFLGVYNTSFIFKEVKYLREICRDIVIDTRSMMAYLTCFGRIRAVGVTGSPDNTLFKKACMTKLAFDSAGSCLYFTYKNRPAVDRYNLQNDSIQKNITLPFPVHHFIFLQGRLIMTLFDGKIYSYQSKLTPLNIYERFNHKLLVMIAK